MAVNVTGRRVDPVLGYNVLITLVDSSSLLTVSPSGIQAAAAGGFSECSGLETTLEVEEHREGGNNGTVLRFPTRVGWSNIRLRRGVVASDDLWQWYLGFVEGRGKRRDGSIVLQNDAREPVRVWNFVRALPVKWTGPALNASQSQVAVEELEIAHEGLKPSSPAAALAGAIRSLF